MNKTEKASNNNLALYKIVFRSHGIELQETSDVYYTTEQTPPLYSNLATRNPEWTPDEILKTIDEKSAKEKWPAWSIKDSFQCLDLTNHGFEKLFDSQWLYLECKKFNPYAKSGIRFEVVTNKDGLQKWIEIWGEGIELGNSIYKSELLENDLIYFVIGYNNTEPNCVALLNKSEDVIGVSNFFVPDDTVSKWSDLISFIHTEIGLMDIVGYENAKTIGEICALGVESVGDLSIWLKRLH